MYGSNPKSILNHVGAWIVIFYPFMSTGDIMWSACWNSFPYVLHLEQIEGQTKMQAFEKQVVAAAHGPCNTRGVSSVLAAFWVGIEYPMERRVD
ncbi:hypothetical protein EVAR_4049_1 [Eumeta japonica]|uniref:Uncharacterized protein n=1 Tax=Eumeta variegata TaxID=151549 RepID=A0A4C1T6W3_EUMVA|nr:hypothetical protein EVAR_4049_1 [Eumeta japonica]